jgi:hypothetical protein
MTFQTVHIAKKFTSLHYQYSDKMLELARKKVADGTPINLPLWWLDPTDEEALTIDSGESQGQRISFLYHNQTFSLEIFIILNIFKHVL